MMNQRRNFILGAIFAIVISLTTLFTNCSQNKFQTDSANQAASANNPQVSTMSTSNTTRSRLQSFGGTNVQYFGYWGLGMGGSTGHVASASDHSNIVFISDDTFEAVEQKIVQAIKLDLKVILMVQGVTFPWHQYTMHADWQQRWNNLQTKIVDKYSSNILGFYIFDEPYHNFDTHYSGNDKANAAAKFNGEFVKYANYIKSKNSNKIIATTYAYTEVTPYVSHFGIPQSVDWIGVNCYLDFAGVCSESELIRYYSILNNTKSAHQKFMLTLDAYTSQRNCNVSEPKQRDIIDRIDFTLNWAQSNIPVVALTPFLFQEVHGTTEDLCGASTMPIVANRLQTIAQTIVNKSPVQAPPIPPNKPPTQPIPVTTKTHCNGDDMVTVNAANNTEISRVRSHPTCVPKCENSDYVRRNESGVEVDRWRNAPMCATTTNPLPPVQPPAIVTKQKCHSNDLVTINATTGAEISRILSHSTCLPKCESNDLVRRNEVGLEVDRWLTAPMCVPKCEGKDLVRRNELNIVLDTWFNAPMCP